MNGTQPEVLDYYFETEDLPEIEKGIKDCEKMIGKENVQRMDQFFKSHNEWGETQLIEQIKIEEQHKGMTAFDIMIWYARLILGRKIHKCVKKEGTCQFQAEC